MKCIVTESDNAESVPSETYVHLSESELKAAGVHLAVSVFHGTSLHSWSTGYTQGKVKSLNYITSNLMLIFNL